DYRVEADGVPHDDPYRYLPTVGELDLHLISEGRHERLWTVLGARPLARPAGADPAAAADRPAGADRPAAADPPAGADVPAPGGTGFAVWAPNARGVRVVGDFTGWGAHDGWPMRSMGRSGVWELFVPDARPGQRYKYRVLGRDGVWRDKADPL